MVSHLTHFQEVSMIMSRLLGDLDALRYLMTIWKTRGDQWTMEFYNKLYREHNDRPSVVDRHFLIFDLHHFYPKFLARLDPVTKEYGAMTIRAKISLIAQLNSDEKTITMRRKSLYLFKRNNVDESRCYPMEQMIHANHGEFLVGIMNYRSRFKQINK